MFAKQAEFYRDMSRIIRAAKTDGSAVWTLLGVSFLYGIFHAAGPGHGKAVISSYLVANEETWRRGIVLSFASALLQAFVAVAIVGIAAVLLNATAGQMCSAGRVIEIASYALIALVGARLIWVKGKGFLREARGLSRPLHAVGAAVTPPHDHKHARSRASRSRHDHDHDHARSCITTTMRIMATITAMITVITTTITTTTTPRPGAMPTARSRKNWPGRAAGSAACRPSSRSGLRPCSGAIIVLVFALAQGLFWAGVAATFVMGLGTAITVAAIATLAVGFRSAAKQHRRLALRLRHAGAARHRGRRRRRGAGLRRAAARGLHGGRARRLLLIARAWPKPSPPAAASPAAGRPA